MKLDDVVQKVVELSVIPMWLTSAGLTVAWCVILLPINELERRLKGVLG